MREKRKLNLKAVDDLVKTSSFRNLLTLGAKGVQGLGSGMAVGSLVISFLAITGMSLALVFEIVAAAGGAAIFGGLALLITGYHLWKRHKKIKGLKGKFDTELKNVRETLIEVLKNYEFTNQLINELNELLKQESEEQERVALLKKDLKQLEDIKAEHIKHLQLALNIVVAGDSTTAQLSQLFSNVPNAQGQEAIKNYAKDVQLASTEDVRKIESALQDIWHKLDQPVVKGDENTNESEDTKKLKDKSKKLEDKFEKLNELGKDKTHPHIKKVNYALTGVGGFLGGVGATLTITAIAFGGMAALTGIGWPIAVAAIGVGLITMCATLLYYHYIDKKQQTTLNRISLATQQVDGIHKHFEDEMNIENNGLKKQSAKIKKRYENAQKETSNRLRLSEQKIGLERGDTKIREESKMIKGTEDEMNCPKKSDKTVEDHQVGLITSKKTVDSTHYNKPITVTPIKTQQDKSSSKFPRLLNFLRRTPAVMSLEKDESEGEGNRKKGFENSSFLS